jgi:hypothetical protein
MGEYTPCHLFSEVNIARRQKSTLPSALVSLIHISVPPPCSQNANINNIDVISKMVFLKCIFR